MFIDTPTPYTNHILITLHQELEPTPIALWSDAIDCESGL